jgi:hypothetical protein
MDRMGSGALGSFKSIFDVIKALLPVLYCGYLLYYFLGVGGSLQGVGDIGLGPTVLGLAGVGVLFCIPLILKIRRLLHARRTPGSGGDAPKDNDDDDGGAAADAVIARYMARKAAEESAGKPAASFASAGTGAASPAPQSGGPAKRPGFGRRNG